METQSLCVHLNFTSPICCSHRANPDSHMMSLRLTRLIPWQIQKRGYSDPVTQTSGVCFMRWFGCMCPAAGTWDDLRMPSWRWQRHWACTSTTPRSYNCMWLDPVVSVSRVFSAISYVTNCVWRHCGGSTRNNHDLTAVCNLIPVSAFLTVCCLLSLHTEYLVAS